VIPLDVGGVWPSFPVSGRVCNSLVDDVEHGCNLLAFRAYPPRKSQ
jgi:hypothetical protein